MAVTGMFVAAAIKELRQLVLPTMVSLVRHYTMVAIAQQAGPFALSAKQSKLGGMDPLVLIDALAVIMGHEEKELCKVRIVDYVLKVLKAESLVNNFLSFYKSSIKTFGCSFYT
jgi:transformation/transcription domain-associated protein